MRYIGRWVWLCWFIALTSPAMGHQIGGDSYLHLKIDAASIQAQWGIALFSFGNVLALDGNNDGKIAPTRPKHILGDGGVCASAPQTVDNRWHMSPRAGRS
jgi:hypothetical protein